MDRVASRAAHQSDPFVALFVGDDRADIHTSCHSEWMAERDSEARIALGIETPKQRRKRQMNSEPKPMTAKEILAEGWRLTQERMALSGMSIPHD